ncbi:MULTISPECIES: hypothetical protein [Chryseobacterium]|uniref:Uncharacterized protein n=1 Tax=Chryseobacterium camelliae TaxID=1265445 RepID=A0ABU0TDW8_9FLAO|nr:MULTISPECIES: hypothetical protein [Chryseobacterium]MDT3406963.1 hypothetical protein [Pseudacidovorax intermedius]MDQ1095244.1 hypothetical protein [Chryseobacterium camelliae]MDQ1099182.1 hypothetical protein [Chryseobacterium sp. SORGH_AS_1048]MDR6086531.1 hypothetical protein [Chryseobacterium sp. SORGH_AS_0909]MDR6130902.1 hypothetical protein [Chryseobacterium sp. SORGH_AS_1175]
MKKVLLLPFLGIILITNAQVGINNNTPSSTLDIGGSLEGSYREITANSTLSATDYHVSFAGTSAATASLPQMSTSDGSASDFRGRKYFIKNNSSSSNLTLAAVSGQTIRIGGGNTANNTYILSPGVLGILTANATNGWDLDLAVNTIPDTSWKITNNDFNGTLNAAQAIATGNTYQTITGSSVTVTVPPGYNQSIVTLNFDGWGDVDHTGVSMGSLRFQITQSGTSAATYTSTSMTSWAVTNTGVSRIRFTFPAAYSISNLAPGTYTFNIQVVREGELGSAPNAVNIWGIQSTAKVYSKN